MDHSIHTRLSSDELNETALTGATIFGPGDERVGHVSHVHDMGDDAVVVIDVGGFLGIGAKHVAVSVRELAFMRDGAGGVHALTTRGKDAFKAMPEHHD